MNDVLLNSDANLPSLPGVAARIVQLANDPATDMEAVAQAVSMDPALATKILRFVNSPMYAKEREIGSLKNAIVILGLNATISLALSFSLIESMRDQEGSGLDYGLFWRRSLVAATAAKVLGTAVGEMAIEEMFLAALLQDIGMLALDRARPELYAELENEQNSHAALTDYERVRLDRHDHSYTGALLLDEWNLPKRTALAVKASHHPESLEAASLQRFTRCIALSGLVADLFLNGTEAYNYHDLKTDAENWLQLDQQQLDDILDHVADLIPEVESMFNMSIVKDKSPAAILEQAREALVRRNLDAMRMVNELQGTAASLENQARELEESNRRDALTGLYNRGYLDRHLVECFHHSMRSKTPLSIAFVDLDHFKQINDNCGHLTGDLVLKEVAKMLEDNVRKNDIVARYGGEEFILVMRDCPQKAASAVCERTLEALRDTPIRLSTGETLSVTASMGLATNGNPKWFESIEDLVGAADVCVYAAKNNGRDQLQAHA